MIELTCPKCNRQLEIDEGFRGGVCRCFDCGALMTVPAESSQQGPESLQRPETPDEQPAGPRSAGGGTYETASGRQVELTTRQLSQVPVARKRRMGVRIVTATVLILAALGVMVGTGYGMYQLYASQVASEKEKELTAQEAREQVFKIVENPYLTTDQPNLLGLPVQEKTVLMIDSSSAMGRYLSLVKKAALVGFTTLAPSQHFQLIFWSESGPVAHPAKMQPVSEISGAALTGALEPVNASGGISAMPAVERALQGEPEQITLIASQLPYKSEPLLKKLREADVRLVVVLIDGSNRELEELAENTGGTLVEISGGQLQRWYERWLDQGGRDKLPKAE